MWGTGEDFVDYNLANGQPGNILYDFAETIDERDADNFTGFGVNPYKVDEILKAYGVSSKKLKTRSLFFKSLEKAIQEGVKKRYIVDYWVVDDGEIYSMHYIYIETTGNTSGNTIMVCNANSYEKNNKYTDLSFVEKELTYDGKNLFLVAYEVKG